MITLIWPGSLLPLMCMDLAKMALEDPIPLRHGHAMLQCLGCLGSMSGLRGAVSYWHPQVEVTRHLFHPYADQGGPSADYEEWLFSRMRSKGSRFTLGVWGLRVCSLDVAFTSATVRNRSQPSAGVRAIPVWPCLWEVLQRWSFLGGCRRVVASFRVAGVALRDIQTCSGTCRKSSCVAGAMLLRRFQNMCCSFRGRRSTLDVSIVIFRGRRSTLDVSCCVFFANRIGRAASSGDKVQIPWQAWHFVWCAENSRKPRTKHRFWGCNFSGSKENS